MRGIVSRCPKMLPHLALALAPMLGLQGPPPLPDAHGFAGGFAGHSQGALLFAGGANFPSAPPWEGSAKVWHDRVSVACGSASPAATAAEDATTPRSS